MNDTSHKSLSLHLFHRQGSMRGQRQTITEFPAILGRHSEGEVSFDPFIDLEVSQKHARIYREDNQFYIEDLASTNGTFVNGERLGEKAVALRENSEIRFGQRGPILQVSFRGPALPAPTEEALPQTKTFASFSPPSPGADMDSLSDYRLLIMKDVWRAISWRFKVLYGIIAFLLAALLFLALYPPLVHSPPPSKKKEKVSSSSTPTLTRKELENFYRQNSRLEEEISEKYEKRLRHLARELSRLKSEDPQGRARKIAALEKRLHILQREVQKNRPVETKFKAVQKKFESSVLFIYTQIQLRNPQTNKTRLVSAFGTGFMVSKHGHIATNKHVIQPWKFGFLAEQVALLGYNVMKDTQRIAAWPSGERVLNRQGGLNFDKGYNNFRLQNLMVSRTALDSMEVKESLIAPGHKVKYKVHRNDDFDLLILKAQGGPFSPLPLTSGKNLEKLDPVMVLGYPRGTDIMEQGIAQTSPTLGTVRKIEDTIYVSASIIPGNSGGPVFSLEEKVVGICTRVYQKTETLGVCIKSQHIWQLLPAYARSQNKFTDK